MSSVGLTSPRVRQSQAQPPSRRGCHGAPPLHTGPGAAPPSAPLPPLEVLSTLPSSSPPSVICQDRKRAAKPLLFAPNPGRAPDLPLPHLEPIAIHVNDTTPAPRPQVSRVARRARVTKPLLTRLLPTKACTGRETKGGMAKDQMTRWGLSPDPVPSLYVSAVASDPPHPAGRGARDRKHGMPDSLSGSASPFGRHPLQPPRRTPLNSV